MLSVASHHSALSINYKVTLSSSKIDGEGRGVGLPVVSLDMLQGYTIIMSGVENAFLVVREVSRRVRRERHSALLCNGSLAFARPGGYISHPYFQT